jgi:diguanylate cyclase (GGDEF)-like protein
MDIDYFKFYNDRLGHLAGDEALQLCAKILRASCRRADTVARYGGEEFVAVLPGASRKLAAEVGERIRQAVEGFTFAGEEEQPGGTITLSLGAAEFGSDGRTPDELLQAADLRLYRAKEGGRNRVVASG